MIEFRGSATIPTAQYQNVQPEFTVEAETFEEARDLWLARVVEIHRMLGKDLTVENVGADTPKGEKFTCQFSGTELYFDAASHSYGPGEWLSGSKFAGMFTPDFPSDHVSRATAKKYDVDQADVLSWWALKGEVATLHGSMIHAALECFGKFSNLAEKVKGSPWASIENFPSYVVETVESFFDGREDERAGYEVFVANSELNLCGQIDRLVYLPDSDSYVVGDVKTNRSLSKQAKVLPPFTDVVEATNLGIYWLQLSFYAACIEAAGKKVSGLVVYHWDGSEWNDYEHEVIDIEPGLRQLAR